MGATIQVYRDCLGGTPCRFGRRNFKHSAVIAGPSKLHAADLVIPDLRGRLQPPDRGAGRRGHLPGVRRRPDQPRLRGLRGQAGRPGRARRAAVTLAPSPSAPGAPRCAPGARRWLPLPRAVAVSPQVRRPRRRGRHLGDARRGVRPRRPRGYTPSKKELGQTPKRPTAGRRAGRPPPTKPLTQGGGRGSAGAQQRAEAAGGVPARAAAPATAARSGCWSATSSTPAVRSAPGSSAAR